MNRREQRAALRQMLFDDLVDEHLKLLEAYNALHAKMTTALVTVKKEGAPPPDVRQVFDAYFQLYEKRYGEKPAVNRDKDGANIKRLIRSHGLARVLELLRAYFDSVDPFVIGTGHHLGAFTSPNVFTKVMSHSKAPMLSPRTMGNAQAARRFLERYEQQP